MEDPFLHLRQCGCLSCELIVTILDRQREQRGTSWSAPEVLNALAEASAFFLGELYAHHGQAAVGVEARLHAMVCQRIGTPQHGGEPAPARPEGSSLH